MSDTQVLGRKADGKTRVRFVLPWNNKFLLQESQSEKYKGWIRASGGKVNAGETLEQAAIREFFEEFGYQIHQNDLKYLGVDPNPDDGNYHFFLVLDHPLVPGTYETDQEDELDVVLIESTPEAQKYIGFDFRIFDL